MIPLSICSARLPGLGDGIVPATVSSAIRAEWGRNWGGGEGSEGDER